MEEKEIEGILNVVLEMAFDQPVDVLKPAKLPIQMPYALCLLFSILTHLSDYSKWDRTVVTYIKAFNEIVGDSYWNYCLCGKVTSRKLAE